MIPQNKWLQKSNCKILWKYSILFSYHKLDQYTIYVPKIKNEMKQYESFTSLHSFYAALCKLNANHTQPRSYFFVWKTLSSCKKSYKITTTTKIYKIGKYKTVILYLRKNMLIFKNTFWRMFYHNNKYFTSHEFLIWIINNTLIV